MFHPNEIRTGEALSLIVPSRSGACLVAGCPCKDARIVSNRRAAFFAVVARRAGETADRAIAPEPSWRLPGGRAWADNFAIGSAAIAVAFFAVVARRAGETADRAIAPEPSWRLPVVEGA